ncbi:hypothetical protein FSP39_018032 [Pinctada imbricata]|uniref:Uncharacterized protein n=1 Tax=Pinctada imbricata TaxID=66713 RepID=A0AA88Y207_PINIB|nr:hypothetical protein FSP39_018032 [Pinctada imbricata]
MMVYGKWKVTSYSPAFEIAWSKRSKGEAPEKTLQLKKILQDLERHNNPRGIPKDFTSAFSKILEDDFNRAEMELLDRSPDDYDLTPDINNMPYDVYKTLTAHNSYHTIHHVYKRRTRRRVKRASSLEVVNEDSSLQKPIQSPHANSIKSSKSSSGSKKIHFPGFKSIKIGRPESALAKRRQKEKSKKTRFQVDKVEEDPPSTSSDRRKTSDVEMSLLPQA